MVRTKTAVLMEPGRFEIQEKDIAPKPDEVIVRVEVCGLCNWELNHFKGFIGNFPMTLGHEWAGIVVETGSDTTKLKIGDKVTVLPDRLEGFSQYAAVGEEFCFLLNDDIDMKKAFLEPLKCVTTVLHAASPKVGDYGIVTGCGPMGLWCIQALKGQLLAGLIAIDIDDEKLALAAKMGAGAVINSRKENAPQRIREITNGHMADFVIEGTGLPALMEACADYMKSGPARLCIMSYYESGMTNFDFRKFLDKGTTIFTPHPVSEPFPLDTARRAAALINTGSFHMDDMISHTFRLDEIQEAFLTLSRKPRGFIKGVVYPND